MIPFGEFSENGMKEIEMPRAFPHGFDDAGHIFDEIRGENDLSKGELSWLNDLAHRLYRHAGDTAQAAERGPLAEIIEASESTELTYNREGTSVEEATDMWHKQEYLNSCAVCCQQFIINEFLDLNVSEAELCAIAEAQNWYNGEAGGTSAEYVGNLLKLFGIETVTNYSGTFSDIKETLEQGGRVIAAVDGNVLWVEGVGNYPVSGVDHAIEIIDIDDSDPENVMITINDSGCDNGAGKTITYAEFMEAWTPSGGFMVSALPKN